ncbi:MAG TPA: F0F1 ATP synthase subunit delta [Accumulibacter sp.]|uniref:F0F1 ATP synthase subunit delta n=1 Tax=Accumulibacter sp. TaxID=2053492 RepID=UPI002B7E59FA|nr:F0F1 ATP synthase subunit delta [Accumulibacter sp.]HND39383.1 F0F1 ATP synthase subunit delta [Accumulibacter sp.]HNI51074.1 F0F1 ATP synthase subunit delta [Accumulibacter sp.]
MHIDWTTFALEIINFLVLVWILKRFLYKPVLETLNQRRAGIEKTLREAHSAELRAHSLQAQYEGRLADWGKEKAQARAELETELALERSRQMQSLAHDLADERARNAAVDAHRQQEMRREMETAALAQAQQFVTTLLGRLATPALEARMLDLLLADWAKLPDQQLSGLRAAAGDSALEAKVSSAFALDEAQRGRVVEALSQRLGRPVAVVFEVAPGLLAGLRISLGAWQVHFNLTDESASFAAAANHVDG